jgi:NAD+ synthase
VTPVELTAENSQTTDPPMSTQELTDDVVQQPDPFRTNVETMAEECTHFVRSVVEEAAADGVVVGLSGGVDSATAASVAVEALGPESVYGLVMPAAASDEANVRDAQAVAFELGISFRTVDVQPVVDALAESTTQDYWLREMTASSSESGGPVRACEPIEDREGYTEALGNATARARMMAAYFEANLRNRLVLGTGNRTELLLGYFTKYGDGGVDLLPLGGLYKTEVRRLARHLGVPEEIVEKPPTAGLWEGQTDAGELGAPYETVDAVLRKLVEEDCSVERTAAELNVDRSLVAEYDTMYREAEHKRTVPPTPGTHFS